MELNRCSRCGNFYVSDGNVCPKCSTKDVAEFSTFKSYVQENGLENSLNKISGETGISTKNLNRFLGYEEFKNIKNTFENVNNIGDISTGASSTNSKIFNG